MTATHPIPTETLATLDRQLDRACLLHLTMHQLRTLLILHRRGPATMSAVARAIGITSSGMTQVADTLVHRSLIQRTPTYDRRVHHLTLTPAATASLADILLA